MPKSARVVVLSFLAFLTTVVLGVASAFMASLALGAATALIVPGTGTPIAKDVADYLQHATDRYIAPFDPTCTSTTCNPTGIDYPASFWPLGFIGNWCPGYSCDTWNVSVGTGVDHLDRALRGPVGSVVVFGYSQGGAVVASELDKIRNEPQLLAKIDKVVTIGGIENPDGGLWTRLSFIPYVPILNVTPHPAMPVDIDALKGKFYTVGFQYDPVVYAPLYWGNPIALLNALVAFETVHGYYLTPNGNGPNDPIAYGYSQAELEDQMDCTKHKENCRTDKYGNTYIMIPAKSLPLTDLVMSLVPTGLKPIVKPFVDLVTPVLKVIADLGYDWSGDPSVVRPLSILPFNPFQNWLAVGAKLVVAAIQGVQAFLGDLGGLTTTVAPTTPAPGPTTMSLMAAKSAPALTASPNDPPKITSTDQVSGTTTTTLTQTADVVQKPGDVTPTGDTTQSTTTTTLTQTTDVVQKPGDVTPTGDTTRSTATTSKPTPTNEPPATKPEDPTKPADPKLSGSNSDGGQKADGGKKADGGQKADGGKKSDNDKKSDADKKDADSAKAAA
jgi:hypothetical protein